MSDTSSDDSSLESGDGWHSTKRVLKLDEPYETLLKLQTQRKNEQFCDVTIRVEEKTFKAHKNVLAAASEYFFKMFTIDMKEKTSEEIFIESVTAKAMDEILNCIYTGQFSISNKSITEILHAASLMQLTSLLDAVVDAMKTSLTVRNCCLYLKLALLYSFQEVADKVNLFFLKRFRQVARTDDFLQYDVDKIEKILESDDLEIRDEEMVFNFIVTWVNKDLEHREQHFTRLFQHVRLQFISIRFVMDDIRTHTFVHRNHECRDVVDEALAYFISPTVSKAQKPRKCLVPDPDSIMLLPYGKKYLSVNRILPYCKTWENLSVEGLTENTILKSCAVAFNRPVTVLCGGIIGNSDRTSHQVVRFDGIQWMEMPSMKEARCGSAAVFYDDNLYVFEGETYPISPDSTFKAGQSNPDAKNFSTTYEVFDSVSHERSLFQSPWNTPRSYGAAQVVGNKIYLIGGYKLSDRPNIKGKKRCKEVSSDTVAFCPRDKTWKKVVNLNDARASFGCATQDTRIYVVGGYCNSISIVTSAEVLNTEEEVWTRLNSRLRSYWLCETSFSAVCLKDKRIFALDGSSILHVCKNEESWSEEIVRAPAPGIIIPFAYWYSYQSFVKIKMH